MCTSLVIDLFRPPAFFAVKSGLLFKFKLTMPLEADNPSDGAQREVAYSFPPTKVKSSKHECEMFL
jgi:hypothetical protein